MSRLAEKMLAIAEAKKLLETKKNNGLINDPFSKANQEAHQQTAKIAP